MKTNRLEVKPPIIPEPPEGNEVVEQVADNIEADVKARLESGDIELTEAAGQLSLVQLLRDNTLGKLDDKQSFKMLSDLVSKKTPNPIQRIEERQQVDIRVVFADLLQTSPDILQRTIDIARQRNEEVKQRLSLDHNMQLGNRSVGELASSLPPDSDEGLSRPTTTLDEPVERRTNEPIELNDIRQGGDGSRRKIEWETALNRRRPE